MGNNNCKLSHQLNDEPVLLKLKHPICSKCSQTQYSELLRTQCDQFQLNTEHKQLEGKQEIHDEKKTVNICCPKCNKKTILIFSQEDIKSTNIQQLSAVNDGLGEDQQQQHVPDEIFQWMFQFLNAKELFKKIRFTCQRMDKIVCNSLLSLHCLGLHINGLKFAHEVLPRETQLQELNLMANNIGNKEATQIAKVFPSLKQLQILDLSWNKIGKIGATAIANSVNYLKQLQVLNISWNPIEYSGRTAISNATKELTRLRQLGIYEKYSRTIYERIQQIFNQKGTKLDLNFCNIDDGCAIAVAEILPHLTQLQELELNYNQIGYTGAIVIASSISNLTQLQVIRLDSSRIGDTGVTAIANSITNMTRLQQLHLDSNQIGDTGATSLANSISNLTQLQKLHLDYNQIGDTGTTAIANSIIKLPQLQKLHLECNQIGDTGAITIANSIANLTQLQELSLYDNQIGDIGATAIANSIRKLKRLNFLYLYNNNITDPVKQRLKKQFGGKLRIYNCDKTDYTNNDEYPQDTQTLADYN